MNSIGEYVNRLRDNFLAMPFQSRAIAVMLMAVIVIGIGLLLKGDSVSDGVYLFGGTAISDAEMRKAEVAFGQAALRDYEFVGNRIKVPKNKTDEYLRAMTDGNALPAGESARTRDVLQDTSMFVSKDVLNKRITHAREQDIASQIMQFPDVKDASVFFDSQSGGFVSDRKLTASVVVVPYGTDPLSPYTKKRIADLVKGAYAGMQADDVTVTDTNATSSAVDPWLDENDLHYRTKRSYETDWAKKIRDILRPFGSPQVVVDVELDPKLNSQSTTLKYDPDGTTTEESTTNRSVESSSGGGGGVPGVASNAYGNASAKIENSSSNKETELSERVTKVTGTEHTHTETVGLVPIRASVLISLRSSYYDDLWKSNWLTENPDKTEADAPPLATADREQLRTKTKQEIETAVLTIIPRLRAGEDQSPLVKVLDVPDFAFPTETLPQTADAPTAWLADSWKTIAMILLAIAALVVARGAVKNPAPPHPSFEEGFGLEIPKPPVDELAIVEEQSEDAVPTMEVTGTNLKDELNTIIETNPDAAANVLRGWLSDAA